MCGSTHRHDRRHVGLGRQGVVQPGLHAVLQIGIERRVDLQAALLQLVQGDGLVGEQPVHRVVAEVSDVADRGQRVGAPFLDERGRCGRERHRSRLQLVCSCLGDVADRHEVLQHLVTARTRGRRVDERVVAAGRPEQPDQHRRLGQRQLLRRLVEVRLGSRLDAVGVLAEEGDVEVVVQDRRLRLVLDVLDAQGALGVLHLAVEGLRDRRGLLLLVVAGLVVADLLDVLHRQRRSTLGVAAGGVHS